MSEGKRFYVMPQIRIDPFLGYREKIYVVIDKTHKISPKFFMDEFNNEGKANSEAARLNKEHKNE